MKFVVSSSALLSVLQATGKVISSKNTLPILDYFLFDLRDGALKVTASDLETTLVGTIKVDSIETEGVIAAPAKLMLDSLKEFSEQPLTIEANESTWEILISWKTGKFAIPGTSGLSYPTIADISPEDRKELTLEASTLLEGINKSLFATADDELRPVMNGIYMNADKGKLTFVATDAHKLVKYIVETESQVEAAFILPKKPANLLKGILAKEDAEVTLEFDSKNVTVKLKSYTMICRLIEGNYPNYGAVIPTNNPNKVFVDRIELLNGIKRVAVFSNQATNLIKFDIAGAIINLTAQDLDFSVSAQESLACDYVGDKITIGFKSTFLVEILSGIDTPTVVIELADSTRAGVFKPVIGEQAAENALMLLMPMMINA